MQPIFLPIRRPKRVATQPAVDRVLNPVGLGFVDRPDRRVEDTQHLPRQPRVGNRLGRRGDPVPHLPGPRRKRGRSTLARRRHRPQVDDGVRQNEDRAELVNQRQPDRHRREHVGDAEGRLGS